MSLRASLSYWYLYLIYATEWKNDLYPSGCISLCWWVSHSFGLVLIPRWVLIPHWWRDPQNKPMLKLLEQFFSNQMPFLTSTSYHLCPSHFGVCTHCQLFNQRMLRLGTLPNTSLQLPNKTKIICHTSSLKYQATHHNAHVQTFTAAIINSDL